jgi:hypothetical protein
LDHMTRIHLSLLLKNKQTYISVIVFDGENTIAISSPSEVKYSNQVNA